MGVAEADKNKKKHPGSFTDGLLMADLGVFLKLGPMPKFLSPFFLTGYALSVVG